jgi:hypothetical protein
MHLAKFLASSLLQAAWSSQQFSLLPFLWPENSMLAIVLIPIPVYVDFQHHDILVFIQRLF